MKVVQRCLRPRAAWPEVTPRSTVHASDAEWYKIVKEGIHRGIMAEVSEETILRDENGQMILNGAMGIDKYKKINGVILPLLRFITIFGPI